MARPRKTTKFADYLDSLDVADLKVLKTEATSEIRVRERDAIKAKNEAEALKIRDKIRIGSKITFEQRGSAGGELAAEVIGIFTDKVQVEVEGRKRSIALTRIKTVK